MPSKHSRPPLFADYLHFMKAGKFYRLTFQTRAGEQNYSHEFTGAAVDQIRAKERSLKGKKLTVQQWTEFFMEL